jgi:hypothetical protein
MSRVGDVVDPGEYVLRRVSKDPQRYDPSLPLPVSPFEFRPHKDRDTDGLSFYRESELSASKLASLANKPADNYVVVKLKVADLLALGLSVQPLQEEGDHPGHVVIPELTAAVSKDPSKRVWMTEINHKLAELASINVVTEFLQEPHTGDRTSEIEPSTKSESSPRT